MSHSKLAVLVLLACGMAFGSNSAPTTGTVSGTVFDGQTGRPIPGARIAIDGQTSDSQVSDPDGQFSINLTPGKYVVRVTAEGYLDIDIRDVEVTAGASTEASAVMTNKSMVTSVDVVEKASAAGATAEAMLIERKLSAVVSDGLSKEEISSLPASNAASVLEKVTGVSIVGGGFVFVRGLGERYSATQLNTAMIPTTEPEKRVVPLDLFPAELIDNIRILKTYTPDLPAEFSGGLVQMTTVDFPSKRMFRVSLSGGINSLTTFNPFLTYRGSSSDYFGFGGGPRGLPASIPRDQRLVQGTFTPDQMQQFGRAFDDNWEPSQIGSMRPNTSYSMVGGGTWGRIGLVGAFTFSNKPQYQSEYQRYLRQGGDGPVTFTEYEDFRSYTESARMGGVFNLALRLTPANKLAFRNTVTRDTDKEAREFLGYDGGVDSVISSQRLRWVERALTSNSVEGEHAMASLGNSILRWQYTFSRSTRDEPDLREVFRTQLPDGQFVFSAIGSSGVRFFNNLSDWIHEPQIEFGTPFVKGPFSGLLKFGVRATLRDRDFQARRFRYLPIQSSTLDLFASSNELFSAGNIRPTGFQIIEFTRASDSYDASMNVYAGFVMVDMGIGARWRLIGGLRLEDASVNVTSLDPLVPGATPIVAKLWNRDPAPGVNVIYALTRRHNLRFSYSRTYSRPDFRELSPFDFNNVLGGFVVQGNPDLKRASIDNFDARWEWFPGGNQVVAASVFAKEFTDPIEMTILPSNDLRQTYVNAKGARNVGFELEARRNLSFLSRTLRDFSVQSNFTFVDSNIRIRESDATLLTSSKRPLVGQSRYIGNFIAEWSKPKLRSWARFYVNRVSRRLSDVGTFGLPDIYEEGNTFLDFNYQFTPRENGRWTFKFTAENLADNKFRWTQGDFLQRSFRTGRTFTVGLGITVF